MQKKYSTKELTKDLLLLVASGIVVSAFIAMPGLGYAIRPLLKRRTYPPSRVKRTLDRLQKQEYISIKEGKDKVTITLTNKGRKRVLAFNIDEMHLKKDRWDGWWRVVIFDIPEKKRAARDFLRSKLKEIGFVTLQKSVLVTPWECRDIVDFVKHYYDVDGYVYLMKTKEFDGDEKVRKFFKLY